MTITRRDALAHGGKVIAAAAVLPFISSTVHAQEDAELFALYEEYRRLGKKYRASTEASGALYRQFRRLQGDVLAADAPWKAARQAWDDAVAKADARHRLFSVRANTPAGMVLKLKVLRAERQHRNWQEDDPLIRSDDRDLASILMDLERFSGRAI